MSSEKWAAIEGHTGWEVSTYGRIRREGAPVPTKKGTGWDRTVFLGGKRQSVMILMANAFLPNPYNRSRVDIISKSGYFHVDNLQWTSVSGETTRHPLAGEITMLLRLGVTPAEIQEEYQIPLSEILALAETPQKKKALV